MRSVAVTGYDREADVTQALHASFDAHLSKPVAMERLSATLARFDKV